MIDVDERALERNNASLERFQRGGVMNVIFNDIKDRAIDGQVIKFNVPFPYGNGLVMFKPGSFGDVSNRTVGFHIDHIGSTCVGDTDSALELMVDDDGIQFRLDLKKTERSSVVARMCEVGSRNAMSVGCDILDENDETIAEHTVRVVERARLREITLCKEGCAGDNAFAMLVDTTVTPKPVASMRVVPMSE